MEEEHEQTEEQSNMIEYKNAIFALTEEVNILKERNESLEEMHEEFKQHFEKMKRENSDLRLKYYELSSQKKQAEAEAESQIRHFKMMLDSREESIDSQRTRIGESQDIKLIKSNLIRKLEGPFKMREEALKLEIEKLEEQGNELRRENDFLKAELEDAKQDHQRELEKFHHKSLEQTQELQLEIQVLQARENNAKEKELMRGLRRDCDEFKRRNMELQKEVIELKRENANIKEREKGLLLETENSEESARIEREQLLGEMGQIKLQLRNSEQECTNLTKKFNDKIKEIKELDSTNDRLNAQGKELELQLSQAISRFTTTENALRERESEIEDFMLRFEEEEKGKMITDRNEKEILQNEISRLEQALRASEERAQEEHNTTTLKLSDLERERHSMREELEKLKRKHRELQGNYDQLKSTQIRKEKQKIKTENELASIQNKHRSLLSQNHELVVAKEHLEYSINSLEEEIKRLSEEKILWKKERFDLQSQIAELTKRIEAFLHDSAEKISRAKSRVADYRSQLLQADLKIQQLSAQISAGAPSHPLEESFSFHPPQHRNEDFAVPSELYHLTPDPTLLEQEIARTLQLH